MYYVDTNVLLSYIFASDRKHTEAKNIMEKIKKTQIYLSSLTVLEMEASLIRMLRENYDLIDPIKVLLQKFTEEKN